ncbi:MAG TPA: hydrogenase [Verrucomicrobia bacterium]|nr:MAG: hydrogenase [Lentisphaerae bacterium GWF2_57_35]HBA84639.1 hydrogenase [Verrucomicrobiota bacterium]
MDVAWTMHTGFGSWNPALWLAALLIALVVALAIRALGRKDYRKNSAQTKPFISGNEEPAHGGGHIPASNLYWGFLESMKAYYERLVPLHTGMLGDYLVWFLGVLAAVLVIGLVI